jgi:diguanylate cyclase (GGDEF)-like protein/PAS domain S-box-containing protein
MKDSSFYRNILDSIYEGIYFVDQQRRITFWNKGAERITGFKSEEVVNKFCYHNILNHVDELGTRLCVNGCPLHATLLDGVERETSVYLHHKLGHRVPVKAHITMIKENGIIVGAVETFVREGDEFQNDYRLEELRTLAYQDQLTEIPNRRYLDGQLEYHIMIAQRAKFNVGVAFIDIDYFKKVNDIYGHSIGDEVLKMLAKTMKSATRSSDVIGRWGGEEFIIIFNHVSGPILFTVCEKVRMLAEASGLRVEDQEVKITISIGATMICQEDTIEKLIKRADESLYRSKSSGRNKVTLWENSI